MWLPILLVFLWVTIGSSIALYVDDHLKWKPYIAQGTKVTINGLPHWF